MSKPKSYRIYGLLMAVVLLTAAGCDRQQRQTDSTTAADVRLQQLDRELTVGMQTDADSMLV